MSQVTNNLSNISAATIYQRYNAAEKKRDDGFADVLQGTGDNAASSKKNTASQTLSAKTTEKSTVQDYSFTPSTEYQSLADIASTYDLSASTQADTTELADSLYQQGLIDAKSRNAIKESQTVTDSSGGIDIVRLWEEKLSIMQSSGAEANDIKRAKNILRTFKNIRAIASNDFASA